MAALQSNDVGNEGTAALIARLLWLIDDEQLLAASDLLELLESRAAAAASRTEAASQLERNRERLDGLRRSATECRQAKMDFDLETGWTKAQTLFGITTFYKTIPGERCVFIKTEGELQDVSLITLCATIREVDLYNKWVPCCTRSDVVRWKARSRVLAHFAVSAPLMFRVCPVCPPGV